MAPSPPAHARSGVALLLVLIFLVLLSALLIGFFTSVQGEVQASKNYENSVAVRQLVSSATNVIAGQIVDGTRSTKTRRPPGTAGRILPGERLAWASQPGLLRTWDDAGNGWKIFKLYSARDMVVDFDKGSRYSVSEKLAAEIPAKWPAQPALFTDLNEPVLVPDPAGKIARDGEKFRASFPIVDPLAFALDKVEGFALTTPPGYGGRFQGGVPAFDASTDPTAFLSEDRTSNPAPMPVAWIYVLKDGTLTAPDSSADGGRTAVWSKLPAAVTPSRDNPIVGRIAFWTDDETCKLNINTASEPTPWDTPRAVTKADVDYGKYQPAAKEYQRFPGHPFTNALSPVLLPGIEPTAQMKEEIYRLIPRVGTGGTMGGSLSISAAPSPILQDRDRLFANADELLFEPKLDPANSEQRLAISNDRTDLPLLRDRLTPERLRRARFFLTANSRAPEINLFGQPRVSLWPVNVNVSQRTGYDRLAAFCSTVADATGSAATSTRGFYFQRRDSTSPRTDYTSISRNRDLFSYLQTLTATEIPGFGGNFRTKWGTGDRDQILTEIFDYIRCTNLRDPQPTATPYAGNGQVAPILIRSTAGFDAKGFGRFHTISQFGLHFICTYDSAQPTLGLPPTPAIPSGRMIEAAFLFEPFSPSVGWPRLEEKMFIRVDFPAPFTVDGVPLGIPNAGAALDASSALRGIGSCMYSLDRDRGGAGGLRGTVKGLGGSAYPWRGSRVRVGVANANFMRFGGGTALVHIYSGASQVAANLVQTITVQFPAADFPLPDLVTTGTGPARNLAGAPTTVRTVRDYWWSLGSRYGNLAAPPYLPSSGEYSAATRVWPNDSSGNAPGFLMGGIFRKEDVVRSMVPLHGDIRHIAAQSIVGPADWVPCAGGPNNLHWDDRINRFAHIFTEPAGTQFSYGFLNEPGSGPPGPGLPGSAPGDQLTPAEYHYARLPEIRPGAGRVFNLYGDFDNGPAQVVDGAYINKPDEGNVSGPQGYPYWSSRFTAPTDIYFSPNRLVPSAGMLGSLPTGVRRTLAGQPHAWETLLFRPEPGHPGAASPPDHLLMDLFWMPVIEPYAISEPFSTAGKVNLNFEIAPFNYIKRATALVGALKAEEPLAIPTTALPGSPDGAAKIYKLWDSEVADEGWLPDAHGLDPQVRRDWDAAFTGQAPFDKMRKRLSPLATLLPLELKFASGQLFRSATQICELHLPREGMLDDGVTPELPFAYQSGQFWRDHAVTGDNTRERPYANLYAKLTTRSNTFTVHVRAQVLRHLGPRGGGSWSEWSEDIDKQVAEYRGSTLLERYIDPADPTMLDFARQPSASVDNAYRTRIVSAKKFTP